MSVKVLTTIQVQECVCVWEWLQLLKMSPKNFLVNKRKLCLRSLLLTRTHHVYPWGQTNVLNICKSGFLNIWSLLLLLFTSMFSRLAFFFFTAVVGAFLPFLVHCRRLLSPVDPLMNKQLWLLFVSLSLSLQWAGWRRRYSALWPTCCSMRERSSLRTTWITTERCWDTMASQERLESAVIVGRVRWFGGWKIQ